MGWEVVGGDPRGAGGRKGKRESDVILFYLKMYNNNYMDDSLKNERKKNNETEPNRKTEIQ